MIRFFVKNNNFVMLEWGENNNSPYLLRASKGLLSYLNINKGDYMIYSLVVRTYPPRVTLNELKDRVSLLAASLISSEYIELLKFKELKKLPLNKKSNCNYIKKRLRKI